MGETSLLVTRGGSGVPGASGPGQFQPGGHQVGGGAGDMSGSSPAPADHHLQITAASPAAAASQQPLLNQSVVSPAPSQVSHFVTLSLCHFTNIAAIDNDESYFYLSS